MSWLLADLSTGSLAAINEWTSKTNECVEWLRGQSSLPSDTAVYILHFLEPQQKDPSQKNSPLQQSIKDLCEKTYQLSLLMRKNTTANFKVHGLLSGTEITAEVDAEIIPQAFEGPQSESIIGSEVAFMIFGGLTKQPGDAPERIILEPAQVVCRLRNRD